MSVFLLVCIIAAANAVPQGYNYQQQSTIISPPSQELPLGYLPASKPAPGPIRHSHAPVVSQAPHSAPAPIHHDQHQLTSHVIPPAPPLIHHAHQHQHSQSPVHSPAIGNANHLPLQHSQQAHSHQQHQQHQQHQPHQQHHQQQQQIAAVVTKNFYIHSAPEEDEEDERSQTLGGGPARKNYRVVFIKAPSQSSKAAALQLAQAQSEEKTVIYVLSKKTDAADLQASLDTTHSTAHKPEVFFIKYKTPEEAEHAQHQIQAQYDALGGGPTHVSDEGIAPVQSFIGALGDASHSQQTGGHGQGGIAGDRGYLPPTH